MTTGASQNLRNIYLAENGMSGDKNSYLKSTEFFERGGREKKKGSTGWIFKLWLDKRDRRSHRELHG